MPGGAPRVIYVDVALETSNNLHVTSVVPLMNDRARSKLFINHKNKSPDMNFRYVFSEYIKFQSQVSPISSYFGILHGMLNFHDKVHVYVLAYLNYIPVYREM